MKRRNLIKNLALLSLAVALLTGDLLANPFVEDKISQPSFAILKTQGDSLHSNAFVMDGHIHVMSRQLLQGLDIGQRYADVTFDLPRAKVIDYGVALVGEEHIAFKQ